MLHNEILNSCQVHSIHVTMRKFLLLLSLFQVLNFISGAPDNEDEDMIDLSFEILPLILIYTPSACIAPTQIDHIAWVNNGQNLGGMTKFSNSQTSEQIFLCAAEPATSLPDVPVVPSTTQPNSINKYCNFPVVFNEQDILRCATKPKYMIEKMLIMTPSGIQDVPCQKDSDARMHRFFYDLCITEDPIPNEGKIDFEHEMKTLKSRHKFEVFRFCYDSDQKSVLHTEHSIKSPLLLASEALKREEEISYQTMIDAGNYFNRDLLAQKEILDKFSDFVDTPNINEPASSDSPGPNKRYVLQKLVPPEDLAFSLWKKPTYDFLNMKLMRSDLVPLWDHINQLIRTDAIRRNREYHLQTGAYRNPENDINSHGAIPEAWMKVIRFRESVPEAPNGTQYKAISIVMNQFFDDETISNPLPGKCENLCEGFFDGLFPYVGKSIRCCSIKRNVSGAGRSSVDEDLELDFLRFTM